MPAATDWLRGNQAICVFSFDIDAESPILAQGRRYAEHAMTMTHQAFGPLVGVPRILDLLAEYRLKATFFTPGFTADRYPDVVKAVVAAGHEVAHHSYSHREPTGMSPQEQEQDFVRGLEALQRVGVRPRGYRAPMWEATWQTPGIVARHGLLYESSLMDDDRPYVLEVDGKEIVELPPHWSLDDWEQYAFLPDPNIGAIIESPAKVFEQWSSELEAMRRHHCLFMLTCHPFLSGRAGRLETLRKLIEFILAKKDVAILTALQVAEQAIADPGLPRRRLRPVTADPAIYPKA
jgi:peptidoglycan/xylan/chitin deacetylase (PgdA/CDA1 family)